MAKNGNDELVKAEALGCKATEGQYYFAHLRVIGGMTPEQRVEFREGCAPLSVDTCPYCDSPCVAHIESPRGLKHICAECFWTWEECHFVTAPAEEREG